MTQSIVVAARRAFGTPSLLAAARQAYVALSHRFGDISTAEAAGEPAYAIEAMRALAPHVDNEALGVLGVPPGASAAEVYAFLDRYEESVLNRLEERAPQPSAFAMQADDKAHCDVVFYDPRSVGPDGDQVLVARALRINGQKVHMPAGYEVKVTAGPNQVVAIDLRIFPTRLEFRAGAPDAEQTPAGTP